MSDSVNVWETLSCVKQVQRPHERFVGLVAELRVGHASVMVAGDPTDVLSVADELQTAFGHEPVLSMDFIDVETGDRRLDSLSNAFCEATEVRELVVSL